MERAVRVRTRPAAQYLSRGLRLLPLAQPVDARGCGRSRKVAALFASASPEAAAPPRTVVAIAAAARRADQHRGVQSRLAVRGFQAPLRGRLRPSVNDRGQRPAAARRRRVDLPARPRGCA
ncbi:MAG: hypothetical protein MZW92_40680 [Comamonadaceae bacterium]|nr:hypothetical protein [Comamonadaceae bacterium]